jgi:hypothetical protein
MTIPTTFSPIAIVKALVLNSRIVRGARCRAVTASPEPIAKT